MPLRLHTRRVTHPILFHVKPPTRSFHATARPQFLESIILSTHTVLQTLHTTTSLPWSVLLPLTALSTRLLVALPVTIYTRRAQLRQISLQPLLHAWRHQIHRSTMKSSGYLGPERVKLEEEKMLRMKRRELNKRWKCGYWKNLLPLVQLPVWLLVVETVRGMCGANRGLVGLVMGRNFGGGDVVEGVDKILSEDGLVEAAAAALPLIPKDISLETEGMLWFQDLTVSDPMLILPFMLSASMLLNLMPSRRRTVGAVGPPSPWRRRLERSLQVLALCIGPLTLHVPSGMLLYWVSSSLLAFGQGVVLDRVMPLKPPITPCKPKIRRLPGVR